MTARGHRTHIETCHHTQKIRKREKGAAHTNSGKRGFWALWVGAGFWGDAGNSRPEFGAQCRCCVFPCRPCSPAPMSEPAWLDEPSLAALAHVDIDSTHALAAGMTEADLDWADDSLTTKCVSSAAPTPHLLSPPSPKLLSRNISEKSHAIAAEDGQNAALWLQGDFSAFLVGASPPLASSLPCALPPPGDMSADVTKLLYSGDANAVRADSAPSAPVAQSPPPTKRARSVSPPPLPAGPFPLSWSHAEATDDVGLLFGALRAALSASACDHTFDPSTCTVRPSPLSPSPPAAPLVCVCGHACIFCILCRAPACVTGVWRGPGVGCGIGACPLCVPSACAPIPPRVAVRVVWLWMWVRGICFACAGRVCVCVCVRWSMLPPPSPVGWGMRAAVYVWVWVGLFVCVSPFFCGSVCVRFYSRPAPWNLLSYVCVLPLPSPPPSPVHSSW